MEAFWFWNPHVIVTKFSSQITLSGRLPQWSKFRQTANVGPFHPFTRWRTKCASLPPSIFSKKTSEKIDRVSDQHITYHWYPTIHYSPTKESNCDIGQVKCYSSLPAGSTSCSPFDILPKSSRSCRSCTSIFLDFLPTFTGSERETHKVCTVFETAMPIFSQSC